MSRIGVIEWEIGSGGGRHSTMINFADCLHEDGHDVLVFSQVSDAQRALKRYATRSLPTNRVVDIPLSRRYATKNDIPRMWHGLDLLIVSCGGLGHVQKFVDVPVVAWVIHPDQQRHAVCVRNWTNSIATRKRLRCCPEWADAEIEVVIPPHDYSAFRAAAAEHRHYDVIVIGAAIPSKRLVEAAKQATRRGLHVVAIVRRSRMVPPETQETIISELIATCETHVDLDRDQVARLFGLSKHYVSLSTDESCSLAIYEALNAGCVPVVLDVGSAREQIGDCGFVVGSPKDAMDAIGQIPRDRGLLERGMSFDRSSVLPALRAAVERAMLCQ